MIYNFNYLTLNDDSIINKDTAYYTARKAEAQRYLGLVIDSNMVSIYKRVIDECNEFLQNS